jgi:hypothetical protein
MRFNIENNPSKRPEQRARMRENNPMKRPEIQEKVSKKLKERFSFKENHPMFGRKNPSLSEWNRNHNPWKGKKNPKHSAWMKENCPMKSPEVALKVSKALTGIKRPYVSERMKTMIGEKNYMFKRMNAGHAAYMNSCNKSPSKPQVKLFEKVKLLYPSAILNYPCLNYSIDIAVPELKLAIEYDEPYWHRGKEEYDMKRQEEIEMEGWKFKRYNRVPNFEQLQREI